MGLEKLTDDERLFVYRLQATNNIKYKIIVGIFLLFILIIGIWGFSSVYTFREMLAAVGTSAGLGIIAFISIFQQYVKNQRKTLRIINKLLEDEKK